MEEQQKARIEQRKRMEVTIKRMDHLERARREVEAPLLQEQYAESLKVRLVRLCMLLSCIGGALCSRSSVPGPPMLHLMLLAARGSQHGAGREMR